MIILETLQWDNWFSYGEDNYIDLASSPLTQISGKNGSGKSSIPLIIQEILYGKNSAGKRKSQLQNRYLNKPISGILTFSKDSDKYEIHYSRKSTLSLLLLKNGKDISSHSSTNTYKTIYDILDRDFKVLSQLMYQSSTSNLEFLTATDTNRKKFLIGLFNLEKYLEIHEHFKKIYTDLNSEVLVIRGKVATIEEWISKHAKTDLNEKELQDIPELKKEDIDRLTELKVERSTIHETNKRINDNNSYMELRNNIDMSQVSKVIQIPYDIKELNEEKRLLQQDIAIANKDIKTHEETIKHLESLGDSCPTCLQGIPSEFKQKLLAEPKEKIKALTDLANDVEEQIQSLNKKIDETVKRVNEKNKQQKVTEELERLSILIDNSLPKDAIDEDKLKINIKELEDHILTLQKEIKEITAYNSSVDTHNSKVKVIKEQLDEYKEQLKEVSEEVKEKEKVLDKIEILKKAFGPHGLISYKVDFLIKDLENELNLYLTELSGGRFQLDFVLKEEKLNINIVDDGKEIGIEELSAGELARINAATLLAIRKLMAAISSTKLNLLFLDEIMGVLDDDGKEKLIEVLLAEENLNTFIVSHEYSHPLIPKINIIKENKISRVENG